MRYIICALPRSRTFWLSVVLSYKGEVCLHDPVGKFGLEIPEADGISDTSAWMLYPELCKKYPESRWICIWREPKEVADSLWKLGMAPVNLEMAVPLLKEISDRAYLTVPYNDIDSMSTIIWEVAGIKNPYSRKYWEKMKRINLQERCPLVRREK